MVEWRIALLLLAIRLPSSAGAASVDVADAYLSKESHPVPPGWRKLRRAVPEGPLLLSLGLARPHIDELERRLHAVSDPHSLHYGQYLGRDEVTRLLQPSHASARRVRQWLAEHDIHDDRVLESSASDWLTINTTVDEAETLLKTEYHEYWNDDIQRLAIRAPSWSLPAFVHGDIDAVLPTSSFLYAPTMERIDFARSIDASERIREEPVVPGVSLNRLAESLDKGPASPVSSPHELSSVETLCNHSAVTSMCVRQIYGFLDYEAKAINLNSMALVNFGGEFNNRSDIQLLLESERPEAARAGVAFDFQTDNIAGAVNQQSPASPEQLAAKVGREGDLDAEILLALAYPTPLTAYSVGGIAPQFTPDAFTPDDTNEPFLAWINHLLQQEELPHVIAISYGDIEQTVPYSYAKRVCDGFMALGARGVTVIFGAGDWGVGKSGYCRSNNGSEAFEFLSSFPASCPYGTSVGATRVVDEEEIVAFNDRNGFVSGGGFSRYFRRPEWQTEYGQVDGYLSRLRQQHDYLQWVNEGGRAYPDVASLGHRRVMVWNGETYAVDGTSVSAPTFAAVVALVNDALLASNRPTLGFLNPWLYRTGHRAFKDVRSGSTKGCNTSGFPAMEGWDSASGFGSPWFPAFLEWAMKDSASDQEDQASAQRPWYWIA